MKFGMVGDFLNKYSFTDLKTAGAHYAEIQLAKFAPLSDEDLRSIRQKADEAGVLLSSAASFLPGNLILCGPSKVSDDEIVAFVKKAFHACDLLGTQTVVLGSGSARSFSDGSSYDEAVSDFLHVCRLIGDLALEHGILVVIEPLNHFEANLITTVQEGAEFVRKLNHPAVKLLADSYHMRVEQESFEEVRKNIDIIRHLHLACAIPGSNEIREYPTMADTYQVRDFLEIALKSGYKGNLTIEASSKGRPLLSFLPNAVFAVDYWRKNVRFTDEEFFDYDENLISIARYEKKGELPDVLTLNNGKAVTSKEDWEIRRKELYKSAVELQYGTMPPKPEVLKVECIAEPSARCYRITAGTKEKQVRFAFKIFGAGKTENPPVVISGDGCFTAPFTDNFYDAFTNNGIAFVVFSRTDLADDVRHPISYSKEEGASALPDETQKDRQNGPLYDLYPDYTFGAIGAWAWGYSRVLDALELIGGFDLSHVAFTGHSRGAKTAMLAGVLDERCFLVNPVQTNQLSCSCYRISSSVITEDGEEKPSETLADMWKKFPHWCGPEMQNYVDKEDELPFDSHFLKALVAPRRLLISEAASDAWTNLPGGYETTKEAEKVFDFLGCKEHLYWYYRRGFHAHKKIDTEMLVNVMRHEIYGETLFENRFFKKPFKSEK